MPSSGGQTCARSEEHTSELQSHDNLVCRLLLEKNTARDPSRRPPAARLHTGSALLPVRRCAMLRTGQVRRADDPLDALERVVLFFFLMIGRPPKSPPFPSRALSG